MLHNASEKIFYENYYANMVRVDEEITQYDYPESFPINKIITRVTTTTEKRAARTVCCVETETGTTGLSSKRNLLKCLLIGGAILTGVGGLAAGGYLYYVAGRQSASGRPENMLPPPSSEPPIPADIFLREVDTNSSTASSHGLRSVVNSTLTPETLPSPYTYYESIYGNTTVPNQTQQRVPATTTTHPAPGYRTTRPILTSSEIEEAMKTYNHDQEREVYYRAMVDDYEYPDLLGPIFHERISSFCHSKKVKDIIEQAYIADAELRCTLLRKIVDTINKFKDKDSELLLIHAQQKILYRSQYGEEVMVRRKLTTLLMAAEFIIDKKDFTAFYIAAMKDYKQHSISDLTIREKKIWSYFPENRCNG